jgi:hypothetical protein
VKKINPNGVTAMALDVGYLAGFVSKLENAFMLEQNLEELQQTVALMQCADQDEFYDISIRNKKYGRVDAMNGPVLLEKYATPTAPFLFPSPVCLLASFFGGDVANREKTGSPRRSRTRPGRRSLTSARASA